jgi:hypothetical protein
MRRQVYTAAILSFMLGIPVSYATDKDQVSPWLSNNAEVFDAWQASKTPRFGPPPGKLTPSSREALQRELPDARFSSDGFPPTRLIFPDRTQEPEPNGPYTIVRVLKVQSVLKAFAMDPPVDPDSAVEDAPPVDYQLLFDQRRVKE